tara:strand:- start:962 stop:1171 length:210 start_codon:yes stop_codon:yes gene_type:complete
MKEVKKNKVTIERLHEISFKEIKAKYPDKIVDAYNENGRLVIVMDNCRIKFDERVPQKHGNIYGTLHRK